MTRTRHFAALPESVTEARRFTTDTLDRIDPDLRDAVELMVSELATNCVIHARTEFDLTIHDSPEEVRVEVSDSATGRPKMRSPGPEEPSGRGLRIVNMLSEDWGVDTTLPGKTVWFRVSSQAAPWTSAAAEPSHC